MWKHSYENDFDLHKNETACWTHFHMKGFALRLVLKQRHKRTRKWPIIVMKLIEVGIFGVQCRSFAWKPRVVRKWCACRTASLVCSDKPKKIAFDWHSIHLNCFDQCVSKLVRIAKRNLKVHFGSFEKDAFPRLQSRLLKLKLDPFTSEVRFKYS